jgi:hypothetical protein
METKQKILLLAGNRILSGTKDIEIGDDYSGSNKIKP